MAENLNQVSEVFVEGLDMTWIIGKPSIMEAQAIGRALKKLGKSPRELLYRGFNGKKLGALLRDGTDMGNNNFIYATPFDYLGIGSADPNPLNYADKHDCMGLACYHKNMMSGSEGDMIYYFNDPSRKLDALAGVLKLFYQGHKRY